MVRRKLAALSGAETEILRIVWQLGDGTVGQVGEKLPGTRKIAYATVQTLLRRLERKGYLKHRNHGKAHVFYPAVQRKDVIGRTVSDFVERLFGGDAMSLVQHLAEHGEISEADIENLKTLVK